MHRATELKDLSFPRACVTWLREKALRNRATTIDCYRDYLKPVIRFLRTQSARTLADIHIGHFVEYQRKHKANYHPASVNHHLNTLAQMLRRAGLWAPIREHYRPLPLPELDPPKVMSETEEDRFFEFAATNPEWQLAYYVASLTNNSSASGKELRMLQLGAIHLDNDPPYFHVPKNMKTPQRQRNIPLNDRGIAMMELLLVQAATRGSTRAEHFLFPFREKRNYFNPNKPASESWLKYRWKLLVGAAMRACIHCLKDKADCQCEHFRPILTFKLKPHNMRHQCITRALDSGVPIETVRQFAGHGVDSLITRGYHHARMEVLARAMDRIDPGQKRPAQPTNGFRRSKGESA